MSIEKLVSLMDKQVELQSAWYRHILTISAGGFAILSGLGPAAPIGIGKYFLAGTWLCLGLGIVGGGTATYLEVSRAKNLADGYKAQLLKDLHEKGQPTVSAPVVVNPNRFFSWAKSLMVVSLLMAVACLVTYSILTTLGV
jgi:hypothetical protein